MVLVLMSHFYHIHHIYLTQQILLSKNSRTHQSIITINNNPCLSSSLEFNNIDLDNMSKQITKLVQKKKKKKK